MLESADLTLDGTAAAVQPDADTEAWPEYERPITHRDERTHRP